MTQFSLAIETVKYELLYIGPKHHKERVNAI